MSHEALATAPALRRVLRTVRRTQGACLIFLWSDQHAELEAVRQRLDNLFRLRSKRLCVHDLSAKAADAPSAAQQQAEAFLQAAVQPQPGDKDNPLWLQIHHQAQAVGQQVLARLNERRAQVFQWPRALIVAGPLNGDAWAASTAPDLWSVRALSLELVTTVDASTQLQNHAAAALPSLVFEGKASATKPPEYQALLKIWQQAWQAYISARAQQKDAKINLDVVLACIEQAFQYQDLEQAEEMLHQVEQYWQGAEASNPSLYTTPLNNRQRSVFLSLKGNLQQAQGQLDLALASYEQSLEIRRKLQVLTNESPQSLRDVSVALNKVGDIQEAKGQLDLALARYEQSLDIAQKLVVLTNESPESLRDVSISLDKVGDIQRAKGQLDLALASYEQSLEIRQKLQGLTNDSPQSLRDVSISLNKVGDIQEAKGQLDLALASYEQSLQIAQKLQVLTNESPQSLRDMSVALNNVGDIQKAKGQLDLALASYEQSLEIDQKLVVLTNESPQSLRDVSISLNQVGDIQEAKGQLGLALVSYEQSLEIRQKLVVLTNESPQSLRDVSVSLNRVGDIQKAKGQLDLALASYEQSLEIRQKLQVLTNKSPQSLRDVSISLNQVGEIQQAQGQLDLALASYEQSLEIRQKLQALTNESPQSLRDWAISAVRVYAVSSDLNLPLPTFPQEWLQRAYVQAQERYGDEVLVAALADILTLVNAPQVGG